jgi:hypothetical protein
MIENNTRHSERKKIKRISSPLPFPTIYSFYCQNKPMKTASNIYLRIWGSNRSRVHYAAPNPSH